MKRLISTGLLAFSLICSGAVYSQSDADTDDLLSLSLEELMNMDITSISKKVEKLKDVASSIYVLTSEDIVGTGATTIHEVLRTVPGYWGTQDEYSSVTPNIRLSRTTSGDDGSVLYLLDGTPILNLMNSAFSFRNFDIPLSQIERIEVIRGSGGTIYGANSATGVVNIFTKNPGEYTGVEANVEGASPGYVATTLSASGALTDKLSALAYGKIRYFKGWESMAGVDEEGNQTVENSRFTKDYDESTMSSVGINLNYQISDRTKLSLRSHFNALSKYDYSNYVTENSLDLSTGTITNDVLVEKKVNSNRLASNIRLDHAFSDSHNLFFRVSTNQENDFLKVSGGFETSSKIYDFEVQDNISIGSKNDLSIGANYRAVNNDIHNIAYTNGVNFIDPQANESLKGAFIQHKVRLLGDKLNFTMGIKGENYTLINDEFYLSPMVKVAYIPSDKLTIWGGYTKSYTTPGFNLTNIDLYLFETPSLESWTAVASRAIYGQVYTSAFQAAIDMGANTATAEASATAAADGFVSSPEGQATISSTASDLLLRTPSIALRNGDTEPTQFKTYEFGFRTNFSKKLSLESNLFYTNVTGSFGTSLDRSFEESITQPGRFASYFLYGNFVEGVSKGAESMIRFSPNDKLFLELSHSYLQSTWQLQESDEYDVNDPTLERDRTPETPDMPEHMFKFRSAYNFEGGFSMNLGIIHVSKHATESGYIYEDERYVLPAVTEQSTTVGKNDSRTIVNLRLEQKLMENRLSLYAFGNDIFNKGAVAQTDNIYNVTLSRIGAMYGFGLNYKFK